jgi:hypothetical protein
LHGKALPWFVSDTLSHDLDYLISTISSSNSGANAAALAAAGKRWASHMESGRWRFDADQFWTTPHPFWWMQEVRVDSCYVLVYIPLGAVHQTMPRSVCAVLKDGCRHCFNRIPQTHKYTISCCLN